MDACNYWKNLCKNKKYTGEIYRFKLQLEIDDNLMRKIKQGITPECMENKWVAYFEDNSYHIHRSWTGYWVATYKFKDNIIYEVISSCKNYKENGYLSKLLTHDGFNEFHS